MKKTEEILTLKGIKIEKKISTKGTPYNQIELFFAEDRKGDGLFSVGFFPKIYKCFDKNIFITGRDKIDKKVKVIKEVYDDGRFPVLTFVFID